MPQFEFFTFKGRAVEDSIIFFVSIFFMAIFFWNTKRTRDHGEHEVLFIPLCALWSIVSFVTDKITNFTGHKGLSSTELKCQYLLIQEEGFESEALHKLILM